MFTTIGQYYSPINIDKKQYLNSHDFGSGLKLMEHSWIGNFFVDAIVRLLIPGGAWHMNKIVWAGDYADNEVNRKKEDKGYNLSGLCYDPKYYDRKQLMLKELKGYAKEQGRKLYIQEKQLIDKIQPEKSAKALAGYNFIVNHTKKEFIDTRKGVKSTHGWKMHPLPIMTCEGNGRGGGDYHGDSKLVGSWARNVISVEKKAPKGYAEIIFDLKE